MLARFVAIVSACAVLCAVPMAATAQEVDRIAAVVNDDIISVHDLDGRLKMAIVMSGMPDSVENRRRAVPTVLRKMVDERLQVQEAKRLSVSVSGEELNRSIRNLEQQNKMPPGGLEAYLKQRAVDPEAVREQIRADVTWMKLINRTIPHTVKVSEEEVGERLDMLRQRLGQPEFMLAEIVLNVDSPRQEDEAKRLGERLLDQLRAGAPFPSLARQFSQGASAASGGMLGWVVEGNLDDEIRTAIVSLGKNEVSPLIRTSTGFSIVAVVDKRVASNQPIKDEKISLAQSFFAAAPELAPAERQKVAAAAVETTQPAKSCNDLDEISRQRKAPKSGRLDSTLMSELPEPVRKALADQPVNKASKPLDDGDGFLVFMICTRVAAERDGLPPRETIRRQIEEEKTELQSKRYLRDLRRAAFIDFRL